VFVIIVVTVRSILQIGRKDPFTHSLYFTETNLKLQKCGYNVHSEIDLHDFINLCSECFSYILVKFEILIVVFHSL